MKYSKRWLYIDLANFVTFLPFFFVLPLYVKFFVITALYFVYKKNTGVIWIYGAVVIVLSFYNLWELKDFRIYVQFLVSLLIWGIYLQRTKNVNFYIKFSPVLLFGLGMVFFQNVYMLFYLLFEIYLFLVVIYSEYFTVKTALKKALVTYLASLPLVTVLFLFFPRVHQKHFIYGFTTSVYESGFDKNPDVKVKSVKLNAVPVVEFKLKKDYGTLYLRGEVLNLFKNGKWYKINPVKDKIEKIDNIVTYYLKQYPTDKKFIFAVDLPLDAEIGKSGPNYCLKSSKILNKLIFIKAESALEYELVPLKYPKTCLSYEKNHNLKTFKTLKFLKGLKNDNEKLNKLINIFKEARISYSLKTSLDYKNIADSLFEKKRGYCVHFASAFAIMCRMVGLPSRIVSGFLAKNPINGYYKVYSKDAHVWTEVLVNGKWKRVDPTLFAYKNRSKKEFEKISPSKINIYISYVRFLIEEWIIKYDSLKQKKFFSFF